MTRPSGPEDENSYENMLVREDRSNVRVGLILTAVLGLGLSSFFDAVRALFLVTPLMLFNTALYGWNIYRMIRTGYVVRGKAMIGNLWRVLAATLILGFTFWVQARYGLWFSQYLRDGFF